MMASDIQLRRTRPETCSPEAPASPSACRHRQISSRRASVAIPSYRLASKATQRGLAMNNEAASFIGNIPEHYDSGLGPMIFVDYAADQPVVDAHEPEREQQPDAQEHEQGDD